MVAQQPTAIVAGAGPGLGQALCRALVDAGYRVAALARSPAPELEALADAFPDRLLPFRCDLTSASDVDEAISQVERWDSSPHVYIHNATPFHTADFLDTAPDTFERAWRTTCLGAVHGAQRVLPAMLTSGRGCLLFIGATASVKAGARFAAFGSAKFALRGLAQAMARELGPKGIHVAHLIIDGVIWSERAQDAFGLRQEQCLLPASIAQTCLEIVRQHPSAWTHELDIRPSGETF